MAERVIRTVRAMPSMASVTAGKMSCFGLQQPADGSQPSTDANNHTTRSASQKLGTAMPATENVMIPPSHHELRRSEARMPRGIPMAKTSAKAAAPRMRLFLPCSATSELILALLVSEFPRSPVSTPSHVAEVLLIDRVVEPERLPEVLTVFGRGRGRQTRRRGVAPREPDRIEHGDRRQDQDDQRVDGASAEAFHSSSTPLAS